VAADDVSLFTNHGAILLALARRPDLRIRAVAAAVGITERAAQGILTDLVEAGYLERTKTGRRNRYLVRGDAPLSDRSGREVADLFRALASEPAPAHPDGEREAVVLACTDFRYQETLRDLLAAAGLLARAEVFLWPGGSAAIGGPQGPGLLRQMVSAVGDEPSTRVVLVAHQGCHARGAYVVPRRDPIETGRAVLRRRRTGIERARRAFGVDPELWFLDPNGAHRVHVRASGRQPAPTGRTQT
jgi:hypothetical protein